MKNFKNYDVIKAEINNIPFNLWVADTDAKRKTGLSKINSMPSNCGMIFIFDKPRTNPFTMRETNIPLTIIFLDDDLKIVSSKKGLPRQKELIYPGDSYRYVIEI